MISKSAAESEHGVCAAKEPWWKPHLSRLLLLAGTLAVLAVFGEIATRLFTDTTPPLTEKDALVGQRYLRAFEDEVFIPEAHREVFLRFNAEGFRGPDFTLRKPSGVRRVAFLGDSMIASLGVDERDTMVGRLQRRLEESFPETNWEVMNWGVSGSSPGQQLALYREVVSGYDPDIVLCGFFVGNDLGDSCRRLSNNPRIYFDLDAEDNLYQVPFSTRRAAVSKFLNRYSRFYVWQKDVTNRARRRICQEAGVLEPGDWIFCREETDDLRHAWRICGKVIAEFKREVESRGASFALVMIPTSKQVHRDHFQRVKELAGEAAEAFDRDYPEERMRALCLDEGVPFLSMTDAFRAAAPSASTEAKEEWLFHDGTGHFNERGNDLAARVVYDFLTNDDAGSTANRPSAGRRR
jgi:hypothetical protein